MGNFVSAMLLPTQSGKTGKMKELIRKYQTFVLGENSGRPILNIIISSNNTALVNQTMTRMEKKEIYELDDMSEMSDFEDTESIDEPFFGEKVIAWHSKKEISVGGKSKKMTEDYVYAQILDGECTSLVCCANSKRFEALVSLLNRLELSSAFGNRKIHIWMDEGDDYFGLWKDMQPDRWSKVEKITVVTATLDSCLRELGEMKIVPFENTYNSETYQSSRNCHIIRISRKEGEGAVSYFQKVFERNEFQAGDILFAPGDKRVKSHDEIAEILGEAGFIVCKLNGSSKKIIYPRELSMFGEETFNDEEAIGVQIAKIYNARGLYNYKFAITGHECISRGITFQMGEVEIDGVKQSCPFFISHAIIPQINDDARAYQLISRVFGNVLQYEHRVPVIATTPEMIETIKRSEYIAMNMAKICFERNTERITTEMEEFKHLKPRGREASNSKMTVPIVVELSDTDMEIMKKIIIKRGGEEKKRVVLGYLKGVLTSKMRQEIDEFECLQITEPKAEKSYKKNIEAVVKASIENRKYALNIKEEDREKNTWQAAFDSAGKRLVFIIYLGA